MTPITPAHLALELGVSPRQIRDVLRDWNGTLPAGTERWLLDESEAESLRAHFRVDVGDHGPTWSLEIGDVVRRRELHRVYGGQEQGGISTPVRIPDIFIFSSHETGSEFGYDQFEGLQPDGSFAYTGEGQRGDQSFVRGNKALRDANVDGRPVRVFTRHGNEVRYVGQFATGDPTYSLRTIADVDRNPRIGIIFNLVPVDADLSTLAVEQSPSAPVATMAVWSPPDAADYVVAQEEPIPPGERMVSRLEFDLQRRFGEWVTKRGTPPVRLRLDVAGTTIEPDLYVEAEGWVVEAKKSTGRAFVRTAIGQVLDYVHIARLAGIERVEPVVLLPGDPGAELVHLMLDLGISVATPEADGFHLASPPA